MERESRVLKMPDGYELDDYWMENVVLKDPKKAEEEFYSAYGYFHNSSLHPLPAYVANKIATAPRYDWYFHHSTNRLRSCASLPEDHNKTKDEKKKKKKNNHNKKRPLLIVNDGGSIKKKNNHHKKRPLLIVNDEGSIKKKTDLIFGLKKQKNSLSWSVVPLPVQENLIADTPLQKEEDEAQENLHMNNHSLNSAVDNDQELIKKMIIGEMGGCDELVLVIKKKLTLTDVSKQPNRLSVPKSQVKNDFLNSQEEAQLAHPETKLRNINVKLLMIQNQQHLQECNVHDINLTCWEMNGGYMYALNKVWYKLVKQHNLEQNMDVQLWAFRIQSQLCFALLRN